MSRIKFIDNKHDIERMETECNTSLKKVVRISSECFNDYFVVTHDKKNDNYTLEMFLKFEKDENSPKDSFIQEIMKDTKKIRILSSGEYKRLQMMLEISTFFLVDYRLGYNDFIIEFIV